MPKNAKVFLAEDYQLVRKLEKIVITDEGHTVELEATSLDEALAKVPTAKEKGINVAVLDGCLTPGLWRNDGMVIAQALKKEIPNIKIIFCSDMVANGGDTYLAKTEAINLGTVINNL